MLKRPMLGIVLSLGLGATAQAHVTLEQPEAPAGSIYKAVLRVGHGCAEGSATTRIAVIVPAGFKGAKPVPKAGWTLAQNGAEISWTAKSEEFFLQDAWYDEFIVRGSLPAEADDLWFKVRQVCVMGESNWVDVPQPGATTPAQPAARLRVVKPGAVPSAPAAASAVAGHAH